MKTSRLLALAATMWALAFPAAALAQSKAPTTPPGNSGNTPAGANGRPFQGDGGMAPVPEPTTWVAMGTLAAAAAVYARRQAKQQKNS
jgi:hypothetical protein